MAEALALEFQAPTGERCDSSGAGRLRRPRRRPDPPAEPLWTPRRGARLGRDRRGPGALGPARRRPPAGDRRAAPGRRRGPRRRAGRRARSATGESFSQLDETLLSTEYGPDGAPAAGRPRALPRRRRASRSGSPATSTRSTRSTSPAASSGSRAALAIRGPERRGAARPRHARAAREATADHGGDLRLRRRPDHPAAELVRGLPGPDRDRRPSRSGGRCRRSPSATAPTRSTSSRPGG